MKTLLTTALLASVMGCTSLDNSIQKAAEINDTMVKSSIETICYRASVGAIRREFDTPEEKDLWSKLCTARDGFGL